VSRHTFKKREFEVDPMYFGNKGLYEFRVGTLSLECRRLMTHFHRFPSRGTQARAAVLLTWRPCHAENHRASNAPRNVLACT
jgi:hypothetical protein